MIVRADRERAPIRRGARWPAGILPAVVALVAQLGLPHLHLLQGRGHESARASSFASSFASRLADSADGSGTSAQLRATPASAEHAESPCAICQTLAQSHLAVTVIDAVPLPVDEPLGTPVPSLAARSTQRRTAHTPRSPPFPA